VISGGGLGAGVLSCGHRRAAPSAAAVGDARQATHLEVLVLLGGDVGLGGAAHGEGGAAGGLCWFVMRLEEGG
jgi:hypothetical protein